MGGVEGEGEDVPGEEGLIVGGWNVEGGYLGSRESEMFRDGQVFKPCELDLGRRRLEKAENGRGEGALIRVWEVNFVGVDGLLLNPWVAESSKEDEVEGSEGSKGPVGLCKDGLESHHCEVGGSEGERPYGIEDGDEGKEMRGGLDLRCYL